LAIDHGDPNLFRLSRIDQYLFHKIVQLATQLGGAEVILPPVFALPP
jgi:hypothetical protein